MVLCILALDAIYFCFSQSRQDSNIFEFEHLARALTAAPERNPEQRQAQDLSTLSGQYAFTANACGLFASAVGLCCGLGIGLSRQRLVVGGCRSSVAWFASVGVSCYLFWLECCFFCSAGVILFVFHLCYD